MSYFFVYTKIFFFLDYGMLTDLIFSYRIVATSQELLQLLIDRYHGPSAEKFTDLQQYHSVLTCIRSK